MPAPRTYRVWQWPPLRGTEGQPGGHINVRFQPRDMLEVAQGYVSTSDEIARGYGSSGYAVA
eukprot:10723694-Alexandrium_andersonii.AAC.1